MQLPLLVLLWTYDNLNGKQVSIIKYIMHIETEKTKTDFLI